jgi:hypothetical protein
MIKQRESRGKMFPDGDESGLFDSERATEGTSDPSAISPDVVHVRALLEFATVLRIAGDLPGARVVYEETLGACQKALGWASFEMAEVFVNLAYISRRNGNFSGADGFLRSAISILDEILPDDPVTARVHFDMARVVFAMGDDNPLALSHSRIAFDRLKAAFGEGHAWVKHADALKKAIEITISIGSIDATDTRIAQLEPQHFSQRKIDEMPYISKKLLPDAIVERWVPRPKGRPTKVDPYDEQLFKFIRKVYGAYLKAGRRSEVRSFIFNNDPDLYQAITTYERRGKELRKLPPDIDMPTRNDLVEERFEKAKREGLKKLTEPERRSVLGKLRRMEPPKDPR